MMDEQQASTELVTSADFKILTPKVAPSGGSPKVSPRGRRGTGTAVPKGARRTVPTPRGRKQ